MSLPIEQLLQPTLLPEQSWSSILSNIDDLSQYHATQTSSQEKRLLGQVFTPLPMARQLISLITDFSVSKEAYADPGTGTGILTAALLSRHAYESTTPPTSITAFESDVRLHQDWKQNFSDICYKLGVPSKECILSSDFYQEAKALLSTGRSSSGKKVSKLITNPPYKKLAANAPISLLLKEYGIYAPNHYAAFIALSVCWLEDNGDLLAIIPRSFFNGSYFKRFRQWLSASMSIEHIVAYKSRSNFGKNVLQENICLYLKKSEQRPMIRISYCEHAQASATHDLIIPSDQVLGDLWRLPAKPEQLQALKTNTERHHTLSTLGIEIKTGAVEVHRAQCKNSLPVHVFYSRDFDANGTITWGETKKPRRFAFGRGVYHLPDCGSGFVVIKRITANDGDKNRIIPTWVSKKSTGLDKISFDNHIQVFCVNDKPIAENAGLSLMKFLQSKEANLCMSAINGCTQINREDLNALKYPNIW